MSRSARSLLVLALVLAPAAASAQGAPPGPAAGGGGGGPSAPAPAGRGAAPASPTTPAAPAPGGPAAGAPAAGAPAAAPAPGAAGAASPAAPDKPKSAGSPGSYSFSDKPARRASAGVQGVKRRVSGPVAMLPGFEQTGDGGSRLFVQLTQGVPVEERKGQGAITYVLKGAAVTKRNNTNSLVTVHFNTPVSSARLVPKGSDLLFVVDLRAAATPTWKMTEAPDKTSVLTVDFPKGDYLTGNESTERTSAEAGAKAPHKGPKKKGGKKGAAAPQAREPEPEQDAPQDTTGPTP